MKYRFATTGESLHVLLHYALTFVLVPDLSRGDIPGLNLQLRLLEEVGSCGDEDGMLQIDAFPQGPSAQAELFIVTYREAGPDISQVGVFTPNEFYLGMRDELDRQLELHPNWKGNAEKLITKFNLMERW
jgi:hypothetical protein